MNVLKKELNDFISVCEFSNLTKAADYLGVKQSGLSKSIMRLEEELGTKLFMRGARIMKLTDAGLILLDEVKLINESWNRALNKTESLQTEIHGQFKISAHPIIAKYILPKIFQKIENKNALHLEIDLSSSKVSVENVIEMKSDIAIVVNPLQYPDLVIKKLWKEHIGLYSIDGKEKDNIFYNPHMINAKEYLAKYSRLKQTEVSDYQVLYSILKRSKNSMCFLPNPIVENEGKLRLIKKMSKDVDVCLVYRQDRLKTKGFRYLVSEILSITENNPFL